MILSINRIRLEFKEGQQRHFCSICNSINRIRLEFKEIYCEIFCYISTVLIESDWNLKVTVNRAMLKSAFSINRIRLEFKVRRLSEQTYPY